MPSAELSLQSKPKSATATKESGTMYISSSGNYYIAPEINADTIKDLRGNFYAQRLILTLKHLLFSEKFHLEILDSDGKQDEKVENDMRKMCDAQEVRLWPKIQMGWMDIFRYGAGLYNPVWDYVDGVYTLLKLRYLPASSFYELPLSSKNIYSHILQGITLNNKNEIEYYQMRDDLKEPAKLENVFMITDPTSVELAGESALLPIIPIISMLNFVWDTQMQQANRTGAKVLFIKVTDGTDDDMSAAMDILQNWGKNTAFPLRGNMELIDPHIKDDSNNLEVIGVLDQMLIDFISPVNILTSANDSAKLGGSDTHRMELILRDLKSINSWLEDAFEIRLLQKYLDVNRYEGYTVHIHIPAPEIGSSEIDIKRADSGFKNQALFTNEIRELIGEEPLADEKLTELEEQYKGIQPPASPFGFASSAATPASELENADDNIVEDTTKNIETASQRLSKGLVAVMVIEEGGNKIAAKKAIDLTIDNYEKNIITSLTDTVFKAHVAGDIVAYDSLSIPVIESKVHQAALDFGKEYSKLLKSEGASIIQGKKIPWLAEHTEHTRQQVYNIVEAGIKEGKPVASIGGKTGVPGTVADDLKQLAIREKDYEYVRIARTETAHVQNQGALNRYTENSITHVNVHDGLDFDEACRAANGQVWTVEYAQSHELEHPNCTRSFSPIIPDDWEPPN